MGGENHCRQVLPRNTFKISYCNKNKEKDCINIPNKNINFNDLNNYHKNYHNTLIDFGSKFNYKKLFENSDELTKSHNYKKFAIIAIITEIFSYQENKSFSTDGFVNNIRNHVRNRNESVAPFLLVNSDENKNHMKKLLYDDCIFFDDHKALLQLDPWHIYSTEYNLIPT